MVSAGSNVSQLCCRRTPGNLLQQFLLLFRSQGLEELHLWVVFLAPCQDGLHAGTYILGLVDIRHCDSLLEGLGGGGDILGLKQSVTACILKKKFFLQESVHVYLI